MGTRISILTAVFALAAAVAASTASAAATSYSGHARPLSVTTFGVKPMRAMPRPTPAVNGWMSGRTLSFSIWQAYRRPMRPQTLRGCWL